jgi:hypothetical protein
MVPSALRHRNYPQLDMLGSPNLFFGSSQLSARAFAVPEILIC